jgi:hypothetical protein
MVRSYGEWLDCAPHHQVAEPVPSSFRTVAANVADGARNDDIKADLRFTAADGADADNED